MTMAEKLGFDLPANFAHKAVADLVMDTEQFEHAQAMLMKSNRILALGEEVVRRTAASALPNSQPYFKLGAQLYALTFGYAEPEKANSGVFNTLPGSELAIQAGDDLLKVELRGGFYKVATSSLAAMRHHSPELAQLLQQLSVTLTDGEKDPAQRSLDIMRGGSTYAVCSSARQTEAYRSSLVRVNAILVPRTSTSYIKKRREN